MAVKFRQQAVKFLQKASAEDVTRIQGALRQLIIAVEEQGIIPFNDQIKGEGEWFYRLRVRKNSAVFTVQIDSGEVDVYTIGARSDVYN